MKYNLSLLDTKFTNFIGSKFQNLNVNLKKKLSVLAVSKGEIKADVQHLQPSVIQALELYMSAFFVVVAAAARALSHPSQTPSTAPLRSSAALPLRV